MAFTPEIFGALCFVALATVTGATTIFLNKILTWLLGTRHQTPGKFEAYECGVPLLGSARERFSVKFYLVALLFVLFDIETVFLLPYAVSYRALGMDGFLAVLAFIAVLGLGLLYILKRRALEWD